MKPSLQPIEVLSFMLNQEARGGGAVVGEGSVEDLGARIARVCKLLGGQERGAQVAGVSLSQMKRYITGRNEPKFVDMARLAIAAGVSIRWLATGDGPMLKPASLPLLPAGPELGEVLARDAPAEGYVYIPCYAPSPGVLQGERVIGEVAFRRDWLRERFGVAPENLACLEAVGDAMAPTIEAGDFILIDQTEPRFRGSGIYAIEVADTWVVKRLQRRLDGSFMVAGDNPRYAPEEIEPSRELSLVGRVIWVGGQV